MSVRAGLRGRTVRSFLPAGAVLLLAALLAACSPITYGTGVSTTEQTLRDITDIVNFTDQPEQIDYQPRPNLVTPPTNTLPPPGTTASAANWPADSDVTVSPANNRPVVVQSAAVPTAPSRKAQLCERADPLVQPPGDYCVMDPNAPIPEIRRGLFARIFG